MFNVGEIVICIKSGADAPNPWHRANPLTVGAEYPVVGGPFQHWHRDGRRLEDTICVDLSGRHWNVSMFRRREEKRGTDIGFAHEILRKATKRKTNA